MGDISDQIYEGTSQEEWWENCHSKDASESHRWFLTGSAGDDVWMNLRINNLLVPGSNVINVGVGTGRCTARLVERGCNVWVVDISNNALSKVSGIVKGGYTPDILQELPKNNTNFAISNLVTQHISNEQLKEQLRGVLPSLRSDGVFAMQFAYSLTERFRSPNEDLINLKGGGVLRSLGLMEQLIYECGGEVHEAFHLGKWPAHNCGWYGLHIRRGSN